MRSAVTICLVPEARRGPFVFHAADMAGGDPPTATSHLGRLERGLEAACRLSAELGFDAVEIFPGGGSEAEFPAAFLRDLLADLSLSLAAVGTGAGWLRHGLSLTDPEPDARARAREFVAGIIAAAGGLGAPAIIGSMQGRGAGPDGREGALEHLAAGLEELGGLAAARGQRLLYEPLNRYETDLFNRQEEAAAFLRGRSGAADGAAGIANVRLLCDLFHMQIEEADPAAALEACGPLVGHVHWADSNRRAVGLGHTAMPAIVAALRRIGYRGALSAEVFPLPTPLEAARRSIESFRRLVVV